MNASELADAAIECMRDFGAKLKATGNPPGRIVCPPGGKVALLEQDSFKGNLCRTVLVDAPKATAFQIDASVAPLPFDKKYDPRGALVRARAESRASVSSKL